MASPASCRRRQWTFFTGLSAPSLRARGGRRGHRRGGRGRRRLSSGTPVDSSSPSLPPDGGGIEPVPSRDHPLVRSRPAASASPAVRSRSGRTRPCRPHRQLADEPLRSPSRRAPYMSTKPKRPFSTRSTATSARAPTDRWPSASCLISRAGFQVDSRDHVVERHAHRQELAHHVEHVLHAGVHAADVQVGRDRVGEEAILHRRHRDAPEEAAAAVADVEDHAALAALEQRRVRRGPTDPARRGARSTRACRCRRAAASSSPARASGRSGWFAPKSTITGMFASVPASTARSTGVHSGPGVVRGLDADDQPWCFRAISAVGCASMSARSCSKLPAAHAVADDVEEGEDAGLRAIDDARA